MITDQKMAEILGREMDLDSAVQALIDGANEGGGEDNISVVLARIEPA